MKIYKNINVNTLKEKKKFMPAFIFSIFRNPAIEVTTTKIISNSQMCKQNKKW